MIFKRRHFEAIPEEAQNNWDVPDEMTKYAKKYFEKNVSDKELKDNITLNSPVPTNSPKAKIMDDSLNCWRNRERRMRLPWTIFSGSYSQKY